MHQHLWAHRIAVKDIALLVGADMHPPHKQLAVLAEQKESLRFTVP
jgi:hypothetical protein